MILATQRNVNWYQKTGDPEYHAGILRDLRGRGLYKQAYEFKKNGWVQLDPQPPRLNTNPWGIPGRQNCSWI